MSSNNQGSNLTRSHIWIILIDARNPPGFTGLSETKLKIDGLCDVDDLRYRIRTDMPDALQNIQHASQLRVYRNHSAYTGETREPPLEPDEPLDLLGLSKTESLVVVVPSQRPTSPLQPAPTIAESLDGM